MRIFLSCLLLLVLTACADLQMPYELRLILMRLDPSLKEHQAYVGDLVFIRIFKEESELELWMQPDNSRNYQLIKTYKICNWSGNLGPKFREGDMQSPEGFYATDLQNLNPNSQYHLSFNMQFPNAYDRAHGLTGTYLMVHGDCISEGCYAMTDPNIEELYVLVERALLNGQTEVPIHAFPFRMTDARLTQAWTSPHYRFWQNLKEGYDYFENRRVPPKWIVRSGEYVFY